MLEANKSDGVLVEGDACIRVVDPDVALAGLGHVEAAAVGQHLHPGIVRLDLARPVRRAPRHVRIDENGLFARERLGLGDKNLRGCGECAGQHGDARECLYARGIQTC